MTGDTIPAVLASLAQRCPTKTAVVTPDDAATYTGIVYRSNLVAAKLVVLGARKGTVVALLLPNGGDWIWWWAACARIGAVVVPINTFATPEEVYQVLGHSGAHIFVAVPEFAANAYQHDLESRLGVITPMTERVDCPLPQLRRVVWLDEVDSVEAGADAQRVVDGLAADVEASDVLTIVYSSGSTGVPKGVVHSHGSAVRQARRLAALTDTTASTVLWTSMPLNWVGGLEWSLLRVLVSGGTFVTQPWFEPAKALRMFTDAGVNTVTAWGPVVARLREDPAYRDEEFGHIRGLGWLLPQENDRPGSLGMTETLGPHSGWAGSIDDDLPADAAGSWGRALPGVQHRVVDPATGYEVADGQSGELHVRGGGLMMGLHRREREHVFTADGWYPTGDGARLCDGWVFYEGRLDDVIKTAGANVSPAEVIAVLLVRPEVAEAFVVAVPHPVRGQDVGAVLVAADNIHLDVTAILKDVRRQLATYKVPRLVRVVRADEIPWLSSQKVDVQALRSMLVDNH